MNGTVSLRSVHGKYLSAQPDGRAEWNRDVASNWEYFRVEQRHNGKIALKGVHGMYVSAQTDGSVQINRRAAPSGGWEEFTVEDRGNNVVCLKSCHGKYLSAQQNGTAQWNRDHAPRGGWEEIQIEQYRKTSEPILNSDSGMIRGESILVSEHSLPKYNGIYTIQNNEINGKPWFKNNSGCILYFYNANSGGGPSWSLDDRSQDGTNDWFRGGWIEPPNSGGPPLGTRSWAILETHRRFEIKMESVSIPDESGEPILNSDSGMLQGEISLKGVHGKYLSAQPDGRAEWNRDHASIWEYFHLEKRQGGKVALKGAHGMYVSAQPDGSVQINRREAPPGGWEEFTVEDRGNDVVCLKSCHGKYLSAQQNGTAQWNRDHAPRGGWEDIQIEHSGDTGQRESAAMAASTPPSVTVSGAGSSEVNGTYVFKPGEHENMNWDTIACHYKHTQKQQQPNLIILIPTTNIK